MSTTCANCGTETSKPKTAITGELVCDEACLEGVRNGVESERYLTIVRKLRELLRS